MPKPCRTRRETALKKYDSRVYSIADFLEWRRSQLLDLSPEFQRRSVWTRAAKSYLIDTVIRGKPFPKILITQELKDQKNIRMVVDGQQRLRAIIEYVSGEFTILKAHNTEYGGRRFEQLPPEIQTDILKYEVSVDLLFDVELADLLDIFARINAYSVVLNTQEKLNAKYLGAFKVSAYKLGQSYAKYFVDAEILSEKQVARMAEAQLSSDLLVAMCTGIQTVKNIERLYKRYESAEEIPEPLENARNCFVEVMKYVGAIYPPEELANTNWSRVHWFYTLFTTIAHSLAGIPGLQDARPELSQNTVGRWRATLDEISAQYDHFTEDDAPEPPKDFQDFIDFSRRRTTDTQARVERTRYVLRQLLDDL